MSGLNSLGSEYYVNLASDDRYGAAKSLLYSYLTANFPDRSLVLEVYDNKVVDILSKNSEVFFNSEKFDIGNLRAHDFTAPAEIELSRKLASEDPVVQTIQSMLLDSNSEIPSVSLLKHIYGEHASYANKNFQRYKDMMIYRKGMIPFAIHPNSVGSTIHYLFTPREKNSLMISSSIKVNYSNIVDSATLGALHDSPEEMVRNLSKYDTFFNEMIPESLHPQIKTLTNHYDLILASRKKFFEKKNISPSKDQLLKDLDKFTAINYTSLSMYASKLIDFIEKTPLKGNILPELDFLTYDLYLKDFFEMGEILNNYSVVEVKAVDLSYNAHGADDLDLKGRISNILKRQSFCDISYTLKIPEHVKNHIRELQEGALCDAENLIITKLLRKESPQLHWTSATNCMIQLYPVFFMGYTPKKNS